MRRIVAISAVLLGLTVSLCAPTVHAAEAGEAATQDMPAAARRTLERLERTIDVDWSRRPLREVLAEIASDNGLTLTLDPAAAERGATPVTLHAAGEPLGQVLSRLGDRLALELRINGEGAILLQPVEGAQPAPAWIDDAQPVREFLPGRSRRRPPPNGWADPVAALGPNDEAALAKPTPATWKALLDGHLERLAAWHQERSSPSPALLAYLAAHKDVRAEFWRAIDPRFDDAAAACAILDRLSARDPKRVAELRHLAIAVAVVHDTPTALSSSRWNLLWAVDTTQFAPALDADGVWDWFSDPQHQALFQFKPKEMAWPLMVHLVDLDLDRDELAWAVQQYGGRKLDLQALYAQVPYDNAKLAGATPRLGSRPYTLADLKQYGGVCVDQAHFASRVAKAFGVPALKCGGNGRYGGIGHAWSGYLGAKDQKPQLLFTGRYQYDLYYLGTAFDPQTGTAVTDREVELLYDGVAGRYETYADARQLARIALALESAQPALAATVAREAAKRDPCVADAWRVLLRTADADAAERTWMQLAKSLPNHPDLVCEGLRLALERLPSLAATGEPAAVRERRQKLYQACFALCGQARRPDLQIQTRLAQIDELAAAGLDEQVITLAFETVRANVREGTLVMPLVKRVTTLANRFAANDPRFRMAVVKDTFAKLAKDFPKTRGDTVSPAWSEWQELVGSLR